MRETFSVSSAATHDEPMNPGLIRQYAADARQACGTCMISRGLAEFSQDISALLRAVQKREIERRGEAQGANGNTYEYHIHGSGYTFRERPGGKEIRFDIVLIEGFHHIRFSAWEIFKYLASQGNAISEGQVAAELRTLSIVDSWIAKVNGDSQEWYYYVESQAR